MKARNHLLLAVFGIYLLSFFSGCESLFPSAPAENELLDGPIEGLNAEEQRAFLAGDIAFNDDIFTPANGLGPTFVANSCGTCHPGDGKGHPTTTLVRFGASGTGPFDPLIELGGPQLQNRAIPGFKPEVVPIEATGVTKLTPPANTGLGFLEAVDDADILAMADPNDTDGDGISGVPNYIDPPDFFVPRSNHIPNNNKFIGRFGKKAGAINLLHQTVNAYIQDIGITSDFALEELQTTGTGVLGGDEVPDPEVSAATVGNVVFYLQTLKAPIPREEQEADVVAGRLLFTQIGCGSCHVPTLTTGVSEIAVLSQKEFHPYTDLLMHDMGPALDDGYTEGTASTAEWRTPPLWGLGLSKDSQGGEYFLMHDGRANSIQEAITLHGGEGANSANSFQSLSSREQEQLIAFLESL